MERPELGIEPERLWLEGRIDTLEHAIKRRDDVPQKWRDELARHYKTLVRFTGLEYEGGKPVTDSEPTLSLLIIDLGESCVVKVEKGNPGELFPKIIVSAYKDSTAVISVPFSGFESVKASIDALEGEKPVPRIEWDGDAYTLHCDGAICFRGTHYDAFCKLAGNVKIPIYEPVPGTWKRLYPVELAMMSSEPTMATQARDEFNAIMPLAVWRYSR